jgi:hypothetical protein
MKIKFGLKLFVLFVLMLFLSLPSAAFAAGSVQVQGFIINADGETVPDAADLHITAIVEGKAGDIQSLENGKISTAPNANFLVVYFFSGGFTPIPAVGENIIININNTKNHQLKVITHTIGTGTTQIMPGSSSAEPLKLEMPPLLSIALTPDAPSVTVPSTQQLTAMGTFEGVAGAVDISSSVTWNTTNGDAGAIDAAGLFTPNLVGITDITASSGSATSNEITLTVLAGPAANVAIDGDDNQTGVVGSDLTLAVKVTDVNGNAVSGEEVTFAITTDPVDGAALSAATGITGTGGTAEVTLTLGTVVNDYITTATVGAIDPVTLTSTATPGPLASYTIEYADFDGTAGVANTITVTAKDANGNTVTNHRGVVAFASTDSGATLPEDYEFTADDNGVKTFNVTFKMADDQTITATTGDVESTVEQTVVAAAAAKIELTSSKDVVASDGIGEATLTIAYQDEFGNPVDSGAGPVTLTLSGDDTSNAVLASEATMAAGLATATFTTTDVVAGDGSVDVVVTAAIDGFTDTVTLSIVNFSITPAASYKAIGETINLSVEGTQGVVTWEVTGDDGVGTLGGYDGDNNQNAVFTIAGAGDATITVTEGDKTAEATLTAYGPIASYKIEYSDFKNIAGNENDITVTAKDANENTVVNYTGTVSFSVTDSQAVPPENFTFVADDKGAKTVNVTLKTAGAQTITATTGDFEGTVEETVVAAAAAKIELTSSKDVVASEGKGEATLTIAYQDEFGNTVDSGTGPVTLTLSGDGTSNAVLASEATMAAGLATAIFTTTDVVAGDGPVDVVVAAAIDGFTDTVTLSIVNFSITPTASNARIGDTINLSVEGAQGTVTWAVTGDAGVGTLGSYLGDNNETAVFTVVKVGDAIITVTENGKTSVATVDAYNDVAITDKPATVVTVKPGADSAEFSVAGGDASYTWSVTGPSSVPDASGSTYTFTAPSTGNFAGEYTIAVTDSIDTNAETFTIYVPLTIDPDQTRFVLSADDDEIDFMVTGAANSTPLTVTIESLDDATEDSEIPKSFVDNAVGFEFEPNDYTVNTTTGPKEYTLDVAVSGHTDLSQITVTLIPSTGFAGVITGTVDPILDAMVTITSPVSFAGRSDKTNDDGVFEFTNLTATDPTGKAIVYEFKVEAEGYISESFDSGDLADDGTTAIALVSSAASLSGMVLEGDRVPLEMVSYAVTLIDASGIVAGPIDTETGSFRFEFETAPAVPVSYTVKAARTGYSGEAAIDVGEFPYTEAIVRVYPITDPEDYTGDGTVEGFVDSTVGGDVPLTPGGKFGTTTVQLGIVGAAGGGIATVVEPVDADPADLTGDNAPESGVEYEIAGLSGGCAIVPVPFDMALADDVANGSLVVWRRHETSPGTWSDWKEVTTIVDVDYMTTDPKVGIIYVKVCEWSSNIFGLSEASSDSGGSGDSSGCFISSLSSGSTHLPLAGIAVLFATAAALTLIRRRKNN